MDLTIIIVSFKSGKILDRCLNSIDSKYPVIVMENSQDQSLKVNLEKNYSNVKCFLTEENLGYGKANNLGLKNVRTKYALILNPDATLESSTLENFLAIAKNNSDFAIIGPEEQEKSSSLKKRNNNDLIKVENVKGFAMFLNLEQFKEVGFFDENFFIYFEEIDLCKRLSKFNKKIYLSPLIKINHLGAQSHDESINKNMELSRNWHWMWSTFYFNKKHFGFFFSLIKVSKKFFSSFIKMIYFSIIFKEKERRIYYQRVSGLFNSIIGKKSWYRPKIT